MASDPYVKLYCTVLVDAKFAAVGVDGFAMYVKGLAYSGQFLTNGFIPSGALDLLGIGMKSPKAVAQKLIAADLWTQVEGGYTVGESRWKDRQRTREEVQESREATRERTRRWREKKREGDASQDMSQERNERVSDAYRKQKTENRTSKTDYKSVDSGQAGQAHLDPRFWETMLEAVGIIPENDLGYQADRLVSHYESKGWQLRDGRSVLTDPRATAEAWSKRWLQPTKPREPQPERITVAGLKVAEE